MKFKLLYLDGFAGRDGMYYKHLVIDIKNKEWKDVIAFIEKYEKEWGEVSHVEMQ